MFPGGRRARVWGTGKLDTIPIGIKVDRFGSMGNCFWLISTGT